MNTQLFDFAVKLPRAKSSSHRHRSTRPDRNQVDDGFLCKHCNMYVSSAAFLSGVQNRNHCPYCLWSRHMDLYAAGDRLSACKSPMKPIGLTTKATNKKYGTGRGELMLIHLCTDCESLSINRIAADDDTQTIFAIFTSAMSLDVLVQRRLQVEDIRLLGEAEREMVRAQLFGQGSSLAETLFSGITARTRVISKT